MDTSEVVEFDVGLSTVGEKLSVLRSHGDCLSVKVNGELKVVVDESFFSPNLQIGRHWKEHRRSLQNKTEKELGWMDGLRFETIEILWRITAPRPDVYKDQ